MPRFDRKVAPLTSATVRKPEDVAAAVLVLRSDQATFITGAVLQVDGGPSAG
jgi:NAD(P)-dependent dehydrogenase (short-subunit alcohol dehydrogenase family)